MFDDLFENEDKKKDMLKFISEMKSDKSRELPDSLRDKFDLWERALNEDTEALIELSLKHGINDGIK